MLAEVRLMIGARESRLMLLNGGEVVDDEIWKFEGKIGASQAAEAARVAFDDIYDFVNASVNGD
jgi:hypothetical protein